jgi:hypothetical protein
LKKKGSIDVGTVVTLSRFRSRGKRKSGGDEAGEIVVIPPRGLPPEVLIPGQAAHRFRDNVAHLFRLIVARHSD